MNSDQIFKLIDDISNEPGKNAKIDMLKANVDDMLLQNVLEYTYNDMKNYGIKNFEMPISYGTDTEIPFGMLDRLIKRELTGNAARDTIYKAMSMLSQDSAELLARIIRKDMRAGFSQSTCNKVWKNLVPEFPYMRCSLPKDVKLDKFSWKDGVYSQVKADGMFCNFNVYDTEGDIPEVTMHSRSGTGMPIEPYMNIVQQATSLRRGYQYHGELTVYRDGVVLPREIGNGILNSVNQGKGEFAPNEYAVFEIWDYIPFESVQSKGKWDRPYKLRYNDINDMLSTSPDNVSLKMIETYIVHSYEEALEHYKKCLNRGLEGTIGKDGNAPWKDGTSKFMFKMKTEVDLDLRSVSIEEGKPNTKNEGRPGAIVCESECGKLSVSVTIKNEEMRDAVEANPDSFLDKIFVVRANMLMTPTGKIELYSLFLPRLVESDYRTDKSEADTLERIQDQFDSVINVK